jgi:diguanylate cyclase (GGDEF)-like protein
VRRLSVEYKLLGAFAAGAAVLALAAWFALVSGREYLDASGRADRLADAGRAVGSLLSALQDAESSQRAYLLSGRSEYLPAYFGAAGASQAALARAQAVLDGDEEANVHLTRLASLVPALIAGRTAVLDTRTRGADAALAALEAATANPAQDPIRAEIRSLDELVANRTRVARERAHAHADNARNAVWLLGVLVIMLLCGSYAFIIGDLRERRRLLARLRQSANHDPLTGLPNRRFFGEWLGFAIAHARREVRHVGLLFIDVDGLKTVDELHGRSSADDLLIEIARRFRETAREGDVLARIGANEFALAIPDVGDPREIAPLAQRLRDALTDPARPPLADTPIGASVGVAFYPDDADDPAGVMAAADAAMYAAKGAGKNRVAFKPMAYAA